MNTKAANRKRWGKYLLVTIGVFILSLFVTALLLALSELWAWAQLAWMFSFWVSILTCAAMPMFLINIIWGRGFPNSQSFFFGINWAVGVGLITGGFTLILMLLSGSYQDNLYDFGCFLPLAAMLGFVIGGLHFIRKTPTWQFIAVQKPPTIVWNYARCPRCDGLWTLGRVVIEIPERCPTCGWSWVDHNLDPRKIPSFVNPSSKTKKR